MKKWCFLLLIVFSDCSPQSEDRTKAGVLPGAHRLSEYLPDLQGKRLAVTVNHSSLIGDTHLTDTLLKSGVDLVRVFTPEHGFTGTASDGQEIEYEDVESAYDLISLYGKNKKPSPEQLEGIDVMVFDIQDVGARFYTYISTMHYVMEACAENEIPLIILDRPNPNASYVDGPVLDTAFSSFVGMHQIPIVHGLTMGELALMINGEDWLKNGLQCEVKVIKIGNWDHQTFYSLPVKPSPNLPNDLSISLYPSLCLFEGTIMSVGRGTDAPFQQIGHPAYPDTLHSFTPISMEGAKWPPHEDLKCFGISWTDRESLNGFSLTPLMEAYTKMSEENFFKDYFKRLAGTDQLQKQIEAGMTEEEIKTSWKGDLEIYKKKRAKYLLYE